MMVSGDKRFRRSTGTAVGMVLLGCSFLRLIGCAGPISTMRSPYHLRTVEVRNATDQPRILKIEPAPAQHLGAATTFTGVLRPGETKSLYLYHGLEYDFRILQSPGYEQLTHRALQVDRDSGLVYTGDSLLLEIALDLRPAPPETHFADSLPLGSARAVGSSQIRPADGRCRPAHAGAYPGAYHYSGSTISFVFDLPGWHAPGTLTGRHSLRAIQTTGRCRRLEDGAFVQSP